MTTTSPRVLITGSRKWTNVFLIHNTLTTFHWMLTDASDHDITLVSGACPEGADAMCEAQAITLGWNVERHPADWERGKQAGFERNQKMVNLGANICLAFIMDDSKGATHTAGLAEKAGIETLRFKRYTNGLSVPHSTEEAAASHSDPDILRGVEVVAGSDRVPEGQGHYR